jgi:hypothetical protein
MKKGQAAIPKRLKDGHKMDKALVIDAEREVLVNPNPDSLLDKGSLSNLSNGMTSEEIMSEIRLEEFSHEAKVAKRGK